MNEEQIVKWIAKDIVSQTLSEEDVKGSVRSYMNDLAKAVEREAIALRSPDERVGCGGNVMASFISVIGPVVEKCGSRRVLDYLYGPAAKVLRMQLARMMYHDDTIELSDQRVQWGKFRKKLLSMAGIEGGCIAEEDSNFEEMVQRVFRRS